MRISDWSSDVCSSDLFDADIGVVHRLPLARPGAVGVGADRPEQATVRGVEIIGGVGGSRQRSVDRRDFPKGIIGVADRRTDRAVARRRGHAARFAVGVVVGDRDLGLVRSEEHTSELQSLMRISYAVFCLTKKN